MNVLELAQRFIRRFGFDVVPFNVAQHPVPRRGRLIKHYAIDTVLDVGANTGQFARELRNSGYGDRIVSFEPLSSAYTRLQADARTDSNWRVLNLALGDRAGEQTFYCAANSESSSLLEMLPLHLDAAPYSHYKGKEIVQVDTLDRLFEDVCAGSRNIYMKVDTQGYEAHVLRGAQRSLGCIDTLQVELSLAPLYAGQALFDEIYSMLTKGGYALVGMESNFADPRTGHQLQLDGIFRRTPVP